MTAKQEGGSQLHPLALEMLGHLHYPDELGNAASLPPDVFRLYEEQVRSLHGTDKRLAVSLCMTHVWLLQNGFNDASEQFLALARIGADGVLLQETMDKAQRAAKTQKDPGPARSGMVAPKGGGIGVGPRQRPKR